jgi:hypothetical protein
VQDLGTKVTARDLPALREGFLAGLRNTPDAQLISSQTYDVGFLVRARRRTSGSAAARRWVRVLYRDNLQIPADRAGSHGGRVRALADVLQAGDDRVPIRRRHSASRAEVAVDEAPDLDAIRASRPD